MNSTDEQHTSADARSNDEPGSTLVERLKQLDWPMLETELNDHGSTVLKGILNAQECLAMGHRYQEDERFRSRVVMSRHGFERTGERRAFTAST